MKNVLIVGMCMPDAQRLNGELKGLFDVDVKWFGSIGEARRYLEENRVDLILVNRICDGDKKSGLELIDSMKGREIPVVLFTGFEKDAKEAVERGAVDAFDLDLLIGYLGPEREKEKMEKVGVLKKFLV